MLANPRPPSVSVLTVEPEMLIFNAVQDSSQKLNSFWLSKKDFRIVSLLNASCSDCVEELEGWKLMLEELDRNKFDIGFFAYDAPLEMVTYNVVNVAKFEDPVFFDRKDRFMKINGITKETTHKTFLTDNNFRVIVEGNPIKRKDVLKKYFDILGK